MLPKIIPPRPPQLFTSLFINYLIIGSCTTATPKESFNKQQARFKIIYSLVSSKFGQCLLPFYYHGVTAPSRPRSPHYRGFTMTLGHITLSRTPLEEWSARRRDLYLTTHNTHKKHPRRRRDSNPQSQQARGRRPTPLDSVATGIGLFITLVTKITRIYRCTVTSVSCIRYQRSTAQQKNPLRVFWGVSVPHLQEFSRGNYDPPWLEHHSFVAKNIPNLASYGMLSRVGLRKYVHLPQWTVASRLQVSSGSISKLNVPHRSAVSAHLYCSTLCSSEAVTWGFTCSQDFSNSLPCYSNNA
jgi:hypothetical protein